ncbi:MAG TPA: hypothetical protein HPP81_06695 [Deltaproteobacteria bacterium]|jgi:hypothetical protein|nr:hypothetical protein [Deltaproteobacteria bacterium]
MRKNHIAGGLIVFSLGLFLVYLNTPFVVQFIKGLLQPLFILVGAVAGIAAVLGDRTLRNINLGVAVVFLFVGLYGLYDEYYTVVDFFHGLYPPLFIVAGLLSVIHGIKKLA